MAGSGHKKIFGTNQITTRSWIPLCDDKSRKPGRVLKIFNNKKASF